MNFVKIDQYIPFFIKNFKIHENGYFQIFFWNIAIHKKKLSLH